MGRIKGRMHASIHADALRRLPELVHDIFESAADLWEQNQWQRFDHREVNCSIQLYRWLREAQRADLQFGVLEIGFEAVMPTPGMINATESVTTAARADLRIQVRGGAVVVEAKRLASKGRWCKEYVDAGMARFVDSTYAPNDTFAVMVGYVQQATTAGLRRRVNRYVLAHELMGPTHEIVRLSSQRQTGWRTSAHARAISPKLNLQHLWLVLPDQ